MFSTAFGESPSRQDWFDVSRNRLKYKKPCHELDMAMGQNLRYLFRRDYHLFKRLLRVTGGTGF